jgi:hypothetical protein
VFRIRIRIKHFWLNTHPYPIQIQGFDDQKWEKIYRWKKKLWYFFKEKKLIYFSLGPSIKVKPSTLKREHPTLQSMKFINFFSIFVGRFCPPESVSNPDPDPKHCL